MRGRGRSPGGLLQVVPRQSPGNTSAEQLEQCAPPGVLELLASHWQRLWHPAVLGQKQRGHTERALPYSHCASRLKCADEYLHVSIMNPSW
ncbi:hypothetical protein TNIN_409801 [Trichonephila inaurata madagascariensis]|uniref:Uncharacterized protein n=1 Tax=Trichonephila inaurata madagascariensis TaxID=2747483 RepID=A0A8X6K306_9ARAC|nr:hypothetical protein TNIN_409801 [Trichonephila inaurata madagascariensis]